MLGLEVVVALVGVIVVASVLERRLGWPAPVVLVALGSVVWLVPSLRGVGLPAEMVLLLFLPALLYWESLTTSAREIRRFARGVLLNGTLLVAATAATVAWVAHALGLDWSVAWIIGAAVAPTDATALGAFASGLPRRQVTTLRAESLINDGTALVIYALAVGTATGTLQVDAASVALRFALSLGGGVAIGIAVAWVMLQVRRLLADAPTDINAVALLTPLLAYLIAEHVEASGVVAVVAGGLYTAREAPRAISAAARRRGTGFWMLTTFLLNAALFALVGLQLPTAVQGLTSDTVAHAALVTVVVFATTLAVRFVFIHVSIAIIRLLDRRPVQRTLRTTPGMRVVSTVAGIRGGVSLAVALAVPEDLAGRDVVIFVVGTLVVLSLVLQGMALPHVIRWAGLKPEEAVGRELDTAALESVLVGLARLDALAADLDTPPDVVERVRGELRDGLAHARASARGDDDGDLARAAEDYRRLRLAVIGAKREAVVDLRDDRIIDDTVLRQVQARLDLEEVRLARSIDVE